MNNRILTSILVIGVVGTLAGGSTLALFNDAELSEDNLFQAGAFDLKVDYNETYNGEPVDSQNLTDDIGPIFNISDVKPGDHGKATISLHLYNNPGYVWFQVNQTADLENGCTDPESDVDDSCGDPGEGEGELGEHMMFTVWYDDGDNELDEGEEVIYNGTAHGVSQTELGSENGTLLDADPSTDQVEPLPNSTTQYVGVKWWVPNSTGNVIQTDSKAFDFTFNAEQARHNDPNEPEEDEEPKDPKDPEEEEENHSYYQLDLVEGDVIEQLDVDNGESYGAQNRLEVEYQGDIEIGQVYQRYHNQVECIEDAEVDVNNGEATVDFEVDEDNCEVSLASYGKNHAGWQPALAEQQELLDNQTQTLNIGNHSMTVDIPQ